MTIGDNSAHRVKGIGSCSIQLNSGFTLQLKNALFVPGIKRNLVSISGLADQGYQITFQEDKVLSLPKNSNIKNAISIEFRDGTLYKLCNHQNLALNHETSNTNEIWHRRLGHLHFRALSSIEIIVIGLPKLKPDQSGICRGCALGKNTKGSFPKGEHKPKFVLELFHTDLCVPMSVPSLSRCLYYVIFIGLF